MIGLFDSGSGGLTVLAALRKIAPSADITYLGDIANAPYGTKSPAELMELTHRGVELLASRGVTHLVSACNSISSSVLAGAADNMPFIEMSGPTANSFKESRGKRLLLLATPATVKANLYEKAFKSIAQVDSLAIVNLASAIEFGSSEDKIENILDEALGSKADEEYDGVILGCTHYPFVSGSIRKVTERYFGNIDIIDPAHAVAEEVAARFDLSGEGKLHFLISKESNLFEEKVANLFPLANYSIDVVSS